MNPIQELIIEGRLKEALNELAKKAPDNLAPVVVNLLVQLNDLERSVMLGLLRHDDASIERSRIVDAALKLNGLVGTDTQSNTGPKSPAAPPTPNPGPPAPTKTKILFLAANPDNETRLQTDREYRLLRAQLERGSQRDAFDFLPPQFAVTITELVRAMNDKPHIVHFSGHGETNGILITTEDNKSQPIPLPALQRLFRPLRGITQVVVLNACYSAEQAKEISSLGFYVVGNNNPITDPAALDLSEGLYNGFGEGKSFEDAFNDAMIVVLTRSTDQAPIIEVWKDGVKLDL
ncbi:MAG: CHAT domain-containing protein [Saprospiraceae bacterium]|nr:CHAT domain-containing protein [Saprospiraceae bacterium]